MRTVLLAFVVGVLVRCSRAEWTTPEDTSPQPYIVQSTQEVLCGKESCMHGGVCVEMSGHLVCVCPDGTRGDFCQEVEECRYLDCEMANATCMYDEERSQAFCQCDPEGPTPVYDKTRKFCTACPCEPHGFCDHNGTEGCLCRNGYMEVNGTCKKCDCGSEGLCHFRDGFKRCYCKPGYKEQHGTCIAIIECHKPGRCWPGICNVTSEGNERCLCPENYTADYNGCNYDGRTECRNLDCSPGKCLYEQGREHCFCPAGYISRGYNCKNENVTTDIYECLNPGRCWPGTCTVSSAGERCLCPQNYTADYLGCNPIVCKNLYCSPGKCLYERGREKCFCPEGYVSDAFNCRAEEKRCSRLDCKPGKCVVRYKDESCLCPEGYTSKDGRCTGEVVTVIPRSVNVVVIVVMVVSVVLAITCIGLCITLCVQRRKGAHV